MVWFATALALGLCQIPQPQQSSPPPTRDVIHLQGGEQLVGEIIKQTGNYIELSLGEGTIVGFDRARVARIERGSRSGKQPERLALAPRDGWFLLHDSDGLSLGYLHALVQPTPAGMFRLSEEWYFKNGTGRTQVTLVEVVDADLRPRTCFYHERVLDQDDRLKSERLVNAEVKGSRLVVVTRSLRGRDNKTYAFPSTASFPLVFRERLRQRPDVRVHAAIEQQFDPKTCEFRVCKASTIARRKVALGGRQTEVREILLDEGRGSNAEWVDANLRVVRREVSGAALVAIPVTEARARRAAVTRLQAASGSAIVPTSTGSMALWLPNPIWRAGRSSAGSVTIEAPLYEATVALMELDQIASDVLPATATDTVARWLRLTVGPSLHVRVRSGFQMRGTRGMRLETEWSVVRKGESRRFRGECYVFRERQRYVVVLCGAPRDSFAALRGDFARILDSVQLAPDEVEPVLQGPLKKSRR